MSQIWLSFCSGISYCLEFSTTSNTDFPALGCPPIVSFFLPFYSIDIFRKDFRGLNSRQQEISKQKLSKIYDIVSIFTQFCAYERQTTSKVFNGHQIRVFYSTLINCSTEIFKETLLTNFGLAAVFVKVTLEITKRAQHCVLLIDMFSCFFEIALVYLRLAGCRAYKGHLQNE